MEVQTLSKRLIKASAPTLPQKVNLSFIDQLAPSVHFGCIFYYPMDPNVIGDTAIESTKMLNQLQKSLSETLTIFYPLAGRYNKEELCVECKDEGAVFWEAQALINIELAEIVRGRPDPELLTHFVPQNFGMTDKSDTPLLAIQANVFKCGGVAIAVRISHKIADAYTLFAFVDAWAKVTRGATGEVIRPNFQHLASLIPAKASPDYELNHFPTTPRRQNIKIVSRRFVFDGAATSSLRAKVGAHTTRLEAVSALMWKALIFASRAKHGHLRASLCSHSVNLRGRYSGLPNPANACGNLYMIATAKFRPNESKVELHDLAGLVGDAIRNTLAGCGKTLPGDSDGFSCIVTESFRNLMGEQLSNREEVDIYNFSSWCRSPYYEADFGWGKPAWVSSFSFPSLMIRLMDTKCGNGIEAWANLEEQDMFHVQRDEDIVAFCSSSKTSRV